MRSLCIVCMVVLGVSLQAQTINELNDYLDAIVREGFGVEIARAQEAQAEGEYKVFRSQLRPQLSLNANLPTYSRTSTSVVQPNGSIAFQPLNQNLASATLSVVQPVLLTGGSFFVEAGLDRFDDIGRKLTQYNGVPVRLGYVQSLVGFNALKWDRRIAKQRRDWATVQRDAAIDVALMDALNRYFDALIARTNQELAQSNREINDKLLRLAEERLLLGKISLEEKLQMEAEFKWATLLEAQAAKEAEQAALSMGDLLSSGVTLGSTLIVPQPLDPELPPLEELVQMALQVAPDIRMAEIELATEERNAAQQRAETGVNLRIYAATGLVQSGSRVSDVYQAPFNEQQVQAGVSIPLLDWGRRAAVKSATHARIEQNQSELEQRRKATENDVKRIYLDLHELTARIELHRELLSLAEERLTIGTARYTAGSLALTEWVLAQRNRDQVRRDYLLSLRDLYLAYFELRRISGYDFITKNQRNYNDFSH